MEYTDLTWYHFALLSFSYLINALWYMMIHKQTDGGERSTGNSNRLCITHLINDLQITDVGGKLCPCFHHYFQHLTGDVP